MSVFETARWHLICVMSIVVAVDMHFCALDTVKIPVTVDWQAIVWFSFHHPLQEAY